MKGRGARLQPPPTVDPCLPASIAPPETVAEVTTTTASSTTTTEAPASEGSSEGSLRWVVLGLVAVAAALGAVTVLYWKHTRPGIDPYAEPGPEHHGTASDVDTGQVAALVGLPVAASATGGSDPDPTLVGVPAGVAAGELPTYESVYGETPYAGGTTGAAGAVLAAGEYQYVEVDEDEIDEADGYEYLEVEVEVDDDSGDGVGGTGPDDR